LKLPDTLILSATHLRDERWQMLIDLSWTGWSSIPKLDVVRSNGVIAQTLDADFRDTWRVAVGANYRYSDTAKLKLGVAFDQTPIRDEEHRLTSLPDNNRLWFSVGGQWAMGKDSALDLGVAYLYMKDSGIRNNQGTTLASPLRGLVAGQYGARAWLLGLQYSSAF
jgi:long-chain fatty acid transport protein